MPKNRVIRQVDRPGVTGGAPVIVETLDDPTPPAAPVPDPPEDLTLTASLYQSAKVSTAQIAATWNPPGSVNPDSYILQWSDDAGFPADASPSLPVSHVPASAQSGSIAPLKLGVTYYVRVATVKNGRQSLWTDAVAIATGNDPTQPTAPTLTLDFSGRDCTITTSGSGYPSANTKDLQLDIATLGGTPLRTVYVNPTTAYSYRLVDNLQDTAQVGAPQLHVTARARSYYDVSSTPATASATNAIPDPVTSVTLSSGPAQVIIQIAYTQPADFDHYRIRVTKDGADWQTVDDPRTYVSLPASADGTYRADVSVVDAYNQESAVSTSAAVACDFFSVAELRSDITYSDSVGNTNFAALKDTITAAGGIAYAASASWRWVQAERVQSDRTKVVTVAFSVNTPAYLGVSVDGSSWSWYSGPVTAGLLTSVADESAAQTAAVNFPSTTIDYLLPLVGQARIVKLGFKAVAGVTLNELYPRRLVQADDIQTATLSAITENVGTLTAGIINGVTIYGGGGTVVLDPIGVHIKAAVAADAWAAPNALTWVDPADATKNIFYAYAYTAPALGGLTDNRGRIYTPGGAAAYGELVLEADPVTGYTPAYINLIGGRDSANPAYADIYGNAARLYGIGRDGHYDAVLQALGGRSSYHASRLLFQAEEITLGYSGVSASVPGTLNVNGAILLGAGTSFPASPPTNALYFRTDLGCFCTYDGAAWYTTQEYEMPLMTLPITTTTAGLTNYGEVPLRQTHSPYITRITLVTSVAGTNNGSNYWTLTVRGLNLARSAATTVDTSNTGGDAAAVTLRDRLPNTSSTPANKQSVQLVAQIGAGSPGALTIDAASIHYKLIVS